jgi:hypothetical protein
MLGKEANIGDKLSWEICRLFGSETFLLEGLQE